MYGLINQGIKDLVVTKFGASAWEEICAEAKAPTQFTALDYYSDKVTYGLVGAASKVLGLPAEAILEEFGKYWVLYTAKEGYGSLMDVFGKDFKTCLKNLNHLHARMGSTMTQLNPPKFTFTEISAQHYQVDYFTERAGLAPLTLGLFKGLAEKYQVKAQIAIERAPDGKSTRYQIRLEE